MPVNEEGYRKYVATGLLLALGLFLAYLLRVFFLAIFGAYVLSFIFAPVHIWLKKKTDRDQLSAVLTILLILAVALVPLFVILYTAFHQALTLQDRFNPQDFSILFQPFGSKIRATVDLSLQHLTQELYGRLTESLPTLFAAASSLGISLVIMFFMMYYIFIDIHYVIIRSTEYLPFSQIHAIWLIHEFEHISKAILLGQILVSSLQGLMGGIGFFIFGLPDAVLWGIVTAVVSLVPLVGTSLVWLPAGVFLLAHNNYTNGVGLLLWGAIVVSHIDNFVRPKLGKRLGNINPIVMVLGAFGGLEFFGIAGVVVGPFLLAFFLLLVQVYRREYLGHPIALSRAHVLTDPVEE